MSELEFKDAADVKTWMDKLAASQAEMKKENFVGIGLLVTYSRALAVLAAEIERLKSDCRIG